MYHFPSVFLLAFTVHTSLLFAADKPANSQHFGANLTNVTDWTTPIPLNNIAKQGRPWMYDHDRQAPKPPVDDLGNWIPEEGKIPFSIMLLPEAKGPTGTYVVKWEGKGKVEMHKTCRSVEMGEAGDNRFELIADASPAIVLQISESDPADPVRNVQCYVPGSENETSPFRKAYWQNGLEQLSAVRYMDWQLTNGSEQEKWENRPTPEQQSFRLGSRRGMPLEHLIEFANTIKANPWFCIPHKADDEYVRNFAQMVKDKLDPNLKVYVEYSNEIWNTAPGFGQTKYSMEQSKTLEQPIPSPNIPVAAWYAHRSKQIWNIWDEVFGGRDAAAKRLIRVAAGWYNNPAISKAKLQAYDLYKSADVFAIAPYTGFNRDIMTGDFDPTKFTPRELAAQVPAQIEDFMGARLDQNVALAKEFNLPLITYEGGIVFATPRKATDIKAATDLVIAASREPSIEGSMELYLRKWFANSPGIMMLFSDYANPGRYGTYDNLGEYPGQPESEAHRRRAVMRVLNDQQLF